MTSTKILMAFGLKSANKSSFARYVDMFYNSQTCSNKQTAACKAPFSQTPSPWVYEKGALHSAI
ncbi:hypothetical protein IWT5_01186 [Secundilactobacillus silagincola]|uniref:Uncharacterized protein n=1 Tax=Secundilactobacillus silagincola TaxID=1714681 RepID=A0A1Z5J1V8_9LACO|nr:hypothetical protein IWT5_01186 [Secundilactobacillus silagincola]